MGGAGTEVLALMRTASKLAVLGTLALGMLLSVRVPAAQADVGIAIGIPFPGITFYAPVPPPVYYPPSAYYSPGYYYGPPAYGSVYYGPPRHYAPAYGSAYFGGGHGGRHHGYGGGHRQGRHSGRRWRTSRGALRN